MEVNDLNKKTKGYSIASLVLGIISVALFWVWYLAIPCSILAIVFGVKVRKIEAENKFAKSGFILGIISASISAALIVCILILLFILNVSIGTLMFNSLESNNLNTINNKQTIERNIRDFEDLESSLTYDINNF